MIRLTVTPDSVDVTPGIPVDLTITVANTGSAPSDVSLRLVGLDPAWITWGEASAFEIPGSTSVDIPVTVTLPPGFPAGAQLIGVEADIVGVARPALGAMQLVVADLEGVRFAMSPASFRGGRKGKFRINVVNKSREPITLRVSGRPAGDDPGELKFEFKPREFTMRPSERVRVRGTVKGKRPIVGAPRVRPLTVVGQSNSSPIHADARFTQRPLLSRRSLRVFGIFIVLSMWAGALVTAVQWSGGRSEQSATDASAETADLDGNGVPDIQQTGEDVDGDGIPDGPPEGEDGGEGGEGVDADGDGVPDDVAPGDETPPGGPVLSGQVTGLDDRSNIVVKGRYVPLAEAIPQGEGGAASDAELAAAGIGDGRKGKVFAAGVTTVDTDDPSKAERETITDDKGFWTLAGVAIGNWELTFSKSGFVTQTRVVTVAEDIAIEPLEVVLAAGNGGLSGTVSSADGPIGGVGSPGTELEFAL